jgi:glycosyltransferase involved in cell wall biosynthesis
LPYDNFLPPEKIPRENTEMPAGGPPFRRVFFLLSGTRNFRKAHVIHGKRLVVVMPAYKAQHTVARTVAEIPPGFVDQIILVDDASPDDTVTVSEALGLTTIRHPKNLGYGGNQKTCYRAALHAGADVVVMLHPDYQYSPRLVPAMASVIASGQYDLALGSRILCGSAMRGGMPAYKYVMNRMLTIIQNFFLRQKLSEYHTGYRAFSREVLEKLPLEENSNDFVFDNEILAQAHFFGFRIGEISCPAKYEPESSSISFRRSVKYGFGVLGTTFRYCLAKCGRPGRLFAPNGRKLTIDPAPAPAPDPNQER